MKKKEILWERVPKTSWVIPARKQYHLTLKVIIPTYFKGKFILKLPTPQHIPLYPDTPKKRRSVLRGKRFVEKVLGTGKKVNPCVALIRRISGTASLREELFCLSPPDLTLFTLSNCRDRLELHLVN